MRFRYALAVLVAIFAVLTLFDRFLLIELLVRRAAIPLLVAMAMALACIGTGRLVRRKPLDWALDFVIGYPIFGTLCFLVGLVKVNVWTISPLALLALGILPIAERPRWKIVQTPALFAVLVVLACGFVAAQAPPSSLDELAYHLAIPHQWVLEGRAVELPLLSQSYFPLGIESADLLPLALLGAADGGVASHFLHLFVVIAVMWLIFRRTQSWLATAAIVTTPALAISAGWSLVDWPLAGTFLVLFIALENDDLDTASVATAAGLLTKYTFLPFALIAWALKRKAPKWPALLGLVFFVRNAILTGNPIAPFFGAAAPHVASYRALALADYIFQGTFVDEALGASIIALPLFAAGLLAAASALVALALFFLAPSSRILVPYLVVPSMSAAPALRRRVLAIVIGIAVVVQTFLVVWFTARGDAFSLLAGSASEQQYLRKQRPVYASIEWLNQTLPPSSRTLVVGSGETYWFARPVRGGGNFDGPRMSRYLDLPSVEALRERLRRDGITHVAVLTPSLTTSVEEKREERETTLSPSAQKTLAQTLNRYTAAIASRGNATLFTLR